MLKPVYKTKFPKLEGPLKLTKMLLIIKNAKNLFKEIKSDKNEKINLLPPEVFSNATLRQKKKLLPVMTCNSTIFIPF